MLSKKLVASDRDFKRAASTSSSSNEILNNSDLIISSLSNDSNSNNNLTTNNDTHANSVSSLDKSFSTSTSSRSSSEKLQTTNSSNEIETNLKYKTTKLSELPQEITPQSIQQKRNRFIQRLSSHAGSFFSKSCPGDDLIDAKSLENQQEKEKEKQKEKEKEPNEKHSRFFAFANAHKQRLAKLTSKKSFDSSIYEPHITLAEQNGRRSSSNENNFYSIANFEVDIEKLTRELSIPSIDKPLTSYKPIEKNCLETVKTNTKNHQK